MSTSFDAMMAKVSASRGGQPPQAAAPSFEEMQQKIAAARASAADQPNPEGAEGFGSNVAAGLRSGLDQTKGLAYGLAALAGDASGHKELYDWAMKGYQATQDEAANEGVRVGAMHQIHSVRDLIDYTGSMIGESLPSLATMAAGGGVGGMLAKKVATSAVERAVIEHGVEGMVAKGVAREAAEASMKRVIEKEVVGASVGAAAANYPNNLSSLYTDIKSDPAAKDAIPTALVTALGMSALEAAPFAAGASSVAKAYVNDAVKETIGKSILKEAPKMAAIMGGTGGAEAALAIGAHAAANPSFDWNSPDAHERVLDAIGGGTLMGTLMGIGTGGLHGLLSRNAESRAAAAGEPGAVAGDLSVDRRVPPQTESAPETAAAPPAETPPTETPAAEAAQGAAAPPAAAPTTENPATRPLFEGYDDLVQPAASTDIRSASHTPEEADSESQHSEPQLSTVGTGGPTRFIGVGDATGKTPADVMPFQSVSRENRAFGDTPYDEKVLDAIRKTAETNPELIKSLHQHGFLDTNEHGEINLTEKGRERLGTHAVDRVEDLVQEGSTVDKAAKRWSEKNPDSEYVPHQLKDGRWVVAEYPRDAMPGERRFSKGVEIPLSEDTRNAYESAKRNARSIDFGKNTEHLKNRNMPFELRSEDGSIKERVNLNLPSISRMGAKLDTEGASFSDVVRHKRGLEIGLSALLGSEHPMETRVNPEGKIVPLFLHSTWVEDHAGRALIGKDRVIYDHEGKTSTWGDMAKVRSYRRSYTPEPKDGGTNMAMKSTEGIVSAHLRDLADKYEAQGQSNRALRMRARARIRDDAPEGEFPVDKYGEDNASASSRDPRAQYGDNRFVYGAGGERVPDVFKVRDESDPVHGVIQDFVKRFGIEGNANQLQIAKDELTWLRDKGTNSDSRLAQVKQAAQYNRLVQKFGTYRADEYIARLQTHLESGTKAFWTKMGDETFIFVDPRLGAGERIHALSHELGHMIADQHFETASNEVKAGLHEAHRAFAEKTGTKPQDFNEWMANQFNHWVSSRREPQNMIEKWFKLGAAKLKDLWDWIRGQHRLTQPFADFMDGVRKNMDLAAQAEKGGPPTELGEKFGPAGVLADPLWGGLPEKSWADMNRPIYTHITPAGKALGIRSANLTPEEGAHKVTDIAKGWIKRVEPVANTVKALKVVIDHGLRAMHTLARQVPGGEDYAKTMTLKAGEAGLHGRSDTHGSDLLRARKFAGIEAGKVKAAVERIAGDKYGTEKYKQGNDAIEAELRRLDGVKGEPNLPPELMPAFKAVRKFMQYGLDKMEAAHIPRGEVKENYWTRALKHSVYTDPAAQADIISGTRKFFGCSEDEAHQLFAFLRNDGQILGGSIEETPLDRTLNEMKSPVAQAMRSRELPKEFWDTVLAAHRETDIALLTHRYGDQLAKRTTYNSWYGMSREELRSKVDPWKDARSARADQIRTEGTTNSEHIGKILDQELPRPRFDPHYKFNQMIANMREKGATEAQIRSIVSIHERQLGYVGRDMDPALKTVMNTGMAYSAMRVLLFAPFGALFDVVGPGIRTADFKQNMRSFMAMASSAEARTQAREGLQSMGLHIDHLAEHVMMDGSHSDTINYPLAKASELFFAYTGLKGLDNFTRMVGWHAGREAIIKNAELMTKGNKSAADFMRELNLTPEHVQRWQADGAGHYTRMDGGTTEEDIAAAERNAWKLKDATSRNAALKATQDMRAGMEANYKVNSALRRIVEESKALNATPGEKPWLFNNAYMAPFFMLKGFTYSFQHRQLSRMWYQLNNKNAPDYQYGWVAPMMGGLALTALGIEGRQVLQYDMTGHSDDKPTAGMDAPEYMMHLVERMGLTGIAQFGIDAAHAAAHGKSAILSFFGPMVDQTESAARDLSKGHWGRPVAQALPGLNNVTGLQKDVATSINNATQ